MGRCGVRSFTAILNFTNTSSRHYSTTSRPTSIFASILYHPSVLLQSDCLKQVRNDSEYVSAKNVWPPPLVLYKSDARPTLSVCSTNALNYLQSPLVIQSLFSRFFTSTLIEFLNLFILCKKKKKKYFSILTETK